MGSMRSSEIAELLHIANKVDREKLKCPASNRRFEPIHVFLHGFGKDLEPETRLFSSVSARGSVKLQY
jgi:hypothetical protein